MKFLNNSNGVMDRKIKNRLDDLQTSDMYINRQKIADSLIDIVSKINDFHDKSATYHDLRFNYSYINKDLLKEGEALINEYFAELEKKYEEVLKNDPILKEKVVITKADLLQREALWEKARKNVDNDLTNRRRASFWKKSVEKMEQNFTEADFQRLNIFEKMYGNTKGLEALRRIEKLMSQENPSFCITPAKNEASQSKHSVLDDLAIRKSDRRLEDKKVKRNEVPPMVR